MDGEFEDWVDPAEPLSDGEPPPELQVSIVRRRSRRRVFAPPTLLCVVACGVLAYRAWSPDWQGVSNLSRLRFVKRSAGAVDVAQRLENSPVLTELAAASPSDPALLPPSALHDSSLRRLALDLSSTEGPSPRDRLERPEAVPGLPGVSSDSLSEGRPDRRMNRAWDDIVRETEAKKAERETFEALRPAVEVRQALEQENGELREFNRTREETEADRVPFRDDLKRAVERFGANAAPAIRVVRQKHMVEVLPGVERNVERALRNAAGRLDWKSRIQLRRAQGQPEALILESLAHDEMQNIRARTGPRNPDEAWVRAARQLLMAPIPPPPPVDPANPPGRGQPVSAR